MKNTMFIEILLIMLILAVCTFTVILADGIADTQGMIKIECKK